MAARHAAAQRGTGAETGLEQHHDQSDRQHAEDPEWGLRELEEVTRVAAGHSLQRLQIVRMPANNLTVVFGRSL
jgi:hypothetical protein